MQPFEIADPRDRDDDAPLDPSMSRALPLGPLTRGMKPTALKRRAQLLIVALPILFFALSCAFSGYQIYWTNMFNKQHPYTEVSQILSRLQELNCQTRMIVDIKPISMDEECPSDYYNREDVGEWGGTVSGCQYPGSGDINVQPCPMSKENNIPERSSQPLFVWRGNKFCTKTTVNYQTAIDTKSSLEKYGKKCASTPTDFYVSATEDCPISDIKILPADTWREPNYKYRTLSDGRLLAFTNDPNKPRRLVDLSSEINGNPCYNPTISPKRYEDDESYPLNRKKEIFGCGEYGNDEESIVRLDKQGAKKFYVENGLRTTVEGLPGWELNHMFKDVLLYAKFRDGLENYEKCDFCDRDVSLDESAKELTVSGKYMSTYVVVTTVVLIFQFFLIAFNLVKYVEYEDNYVGLFNDVVYINALFYFSNLCYFAVHGLIAYSDYSSLFAATEKLKWVEELDCFKGKSLNKLFDDLRGKILFNSKDIMYDCFKAEVIAILLAGGFILATYVNKQMLDRERDMAAVNRFRHEQSGVTRAEYAPQNVSKALPDTQSSNESVVADKEEPKKEKSPTKEEKKEEKKSETTTILDM